MKHKTWFRLVLKALGILLIGMSVTQMGFAVGQFLIYSEFMSVAGTSGSIIWGHSIWLAAGLLQFMIGAYLLMGGDWIINRIIPSNRPYCPDCGYELTNARGERCPECGVMLPRADERAAEQEESGA